MSEETKETLARPAETGTSVAVVLKASDERSATGSVRVQHWDDAARTSRAVKRLALFWLAAIPAIFIPFLHFCLVPGLVLVGPVAAWLAWRQHSLVLGGAGTCPQCGGVVEIDKHPDEWPLQAKCVGCGTWSSVSRAEGEQA